MFSKPDDFESRNDCRNARLRFQMTSLLSPASSMLELSCYEYKRVGPFASALDWRRAVSNNPAPTAG